MRNHSLLLVLIFLFSYLSYSQKIESRGIARAPKNSNGIAGTDILMTKTGNRVILAQAVDTIGCAYQVIYIFDQNGMLLKPDPTIIKRNKPLMNGNIFENDNGDIVYNGLYARAWVVDMYGDIQLQICKLDAQGNIIYEFQDSTANQKSVLDPGRLLHTDDYGFIFPFAFNTSTHRRIAFKLFDQSGHFQREFIVDSLDTAQCRMYTPERIIRTEDGGFLLSASEWKTGFYENKSVLKLDKNFNLMWKVYPDTINFCFVNSMIELPGSKYLILGYNTTGEYKGNDINFIKIFDSQGNEVYQKRFGNNQKDKLWYIFNASDNCFILLGKKLVDSVEKAYILKLNQNFNKVWEIIIKSTDERISLLSLAKAENYLYYIVGSYYTENDPLGQKQFVFTAKLRDTPVSVGDNKNDPKNSLSIYPNPASDVISLSIDSPAAGTARLELFGTLGTKAKEFTFTKSEPAVSRQFDIRDLAPGGYYYRLSVNNECIAGGMFIVTN